jgi:hypothetical protein
MSRWLMRMASFARVAMFDKRGTGMSDRFNRLEMQRFNPFDAASFLIRRTAAYATPTA